MISRVAESCCWLSRHIERTDTLARLLDIHTSVALDSGPDAREAWRPLIIVTGQERAFLEACGESALRNRDTVLDYLTWNETNPVSLRSSLFWARENARMTRETISLEMWESVNEMWLWLGSRKARNLWRSDPHGFYAQIRGEVMHFQGAWWSTMLHEEAFDFMRLGTAMERAGQTARILDVKYHRLGDTSLGRERPMEAAQWLATLRCCSAVEPFFKRSANELSGPAVAGFLLFDRAFPRSVVHNLARAAHVLERIRPSEQPSVGERSATAVAELMRWMDGLTIEKVIAEGMHEALTWVVDNVAGAMGVIDEDFFHPPAAVSAAVAAAGAQA